MGFSEETRRQYADQKEREAARAKWILQPGWHEVTVAGYRVEGDSRNRVTFELVNDAGQKQEVSFGLRISELRGSMLGSFYGAAMGMTNHAAHPTSFRVSRSESFKALRGCRLRALVDKDEKAFARVMAWAAW